MTRLPVADTDTDQVGLADADDLAPPQGTIPWRHVKHYMGCPQRFWYTYRAGLSERGDRTYPRFRAALYGTLGWAADVAGRGGDIPGGSAMSLDLDERYRVEGIAGERGNTGFLRRHGHAVAERFRTRLSRLPSGRRIKLRQWITLPVGASTVALLPAELEYDQDNLVVARLHFFKPQSDSHHKRPEAALLYSALTTAIRVEFWYPLEDAPPIRCALEDRRPELLPAKSRIDPLEKTVAKQLEIVGRAVKRLEESQFEPAPDNYTCCQCGYHCVCQAQV